VRFGQHFQVVILEKTRLALVMDLVELHGANIRNTRISGIGRENPEGLLLLVVYAETRQVRDELSFPLQFIVIEDIAGLLKKRVADLLIFILIVI